MPRQHASTFTRRALLGAMPAVAAGRAGLWNRDVSINDSGIAAFLETLLVTLRDAQQVLVERMRAHIPEDCLWATEPRAIEMRHLHVPTFLGGGPSAEPNLAWFRAPGPIPEDPLLH